MKVRLEDACTVGNPPDIARAWLVLAVNPAHALGLAMAARALRVMVGL